MFGLNPLATQQLYRATLNYFTLTVVLTTPLQYFIDAPFGRFTPSTPSILLVDGIRAWIAMELVSPLCFLYAFTSAPSSPTTRQYTLAGAFLLHYLNRALLSPLRTPSRSKAHLMVPLSAAVFNLVNGSLMGAFLSSPSAPVSTPRFYAGLALWAAGFMGNIVHDEILLNLRRRAKDKKDDGAPPGEHYAIPHGLLYRFVSYPNYLCEWLEWLGFALAAAPPPSLSSLSASLSSISSFSLSSVAHARPSLTPPYAFVLAEVLLMTPRALRGHAWYHERFGDAYPKERRAVVPWVL